MHTLTSLTNTIALVFLMLASTLAHADDKGEAIKAMEDIAREVLPQGFDFSWSGLAFEEKKSGGTSAIAFGFGLLFVFLILAAQYESWSLPGSVITAVPTSAV